MRMVIRLYYYCYQIRKRPTVDCQHRQAIACTVHSANQQFSSHFVVVVVVFSFNKTLVHRIKKHKEY